MRVVIPQHKRNKNHEERNQHKEVAPLPMIPDDNDVDSEQKDYTKSSSYYKLYSDPATAAANATAVLAAAVLEVTTPRLLKRV
jgi:hypothetical protein